MPNQPQREPDLVARLMSHALVGLALWLLFSKAPRGTAATAAVVGVIAHESLDAPVAQKLTDFGF